MIKSGVANAIIGGGGTYSYIRVQINCAERKYMNKCPLNYRVC